MRPERDRNGGVGPQPQRRLLLASHPSSRRGPPRPHRRRQRRRLCPPPCSPLRAPTPPTVPPSPSPFQPSPEDEAGTSTACPICLDALDLAATGNWAWLPSGLRSACPSEAAHGGPKPPALARRPERESGLAATGARLSRWSCSLAPSHCDRRAAAAVALRRGPSRVAAPALGVARLGSNELL